MTDIAPLGPAIRGTIESNMQEAKDKLMPVWHMLRCETNKKQFLNVIDVLDEIFDVKDKTSLFVVNIGSAFESQARRLVVVEK